MSYSNSDFEDASLSLSFSLDDDFDDFSKSDFDDDFDSYDDEDEALDQFDDEDELYYDDVFKEDDDVDEPFDDVEDEDGYSRYVQDNSEELMDDDELKFIDED